MKQNIVILLILLISIIGLSWTIQLRSSTGQRSTKQNSKVNPAGKITQLEPAAFSALVQEGDTFVIDVHTPEQSHLPGTDLFLPYDQIKDSVSELPKDKSQPIAVYCRSGSMSAKAAQMLLELGYTNIYDLSGGAQAYNHQIVENVTITPNTQDLGTVIYGEVGTTTFQVTNGTSKKIEITRLSTSCGCTKAEVTDSIIEPGKTTDILVSFDPAVHGDDTDVGELTRTIYIKTDHPQFSKLERTITATVVKE